MKLVWADNEDGYEIIWSEADRKGFERAAKKMTGYGVQFSPGQVATLRKAAIRGKIALGITRVCGNNDVDFTGSGTAGFVWD